MDAILAIETCVPEASVALWREGEILFQQEFASDRNHNSMVFNPLQQALELLDGFEGGRLTTVLVGTGPGSYSGTRIGIAAAQGVALARGCQAVGIGSFAATPEARAAVTAGEAAMAVGDARRGLYFVAPIAPTGEAMEPELMEADDFASRVEQADASALFTLDEPSKLALDDGLRSRVVQTRPVAPLLIDVWLGLTGERRQGLAAAPLAPSYLRAPFTSKAKGGHPLLRN